ncbi:hypothetical protein Hanom_Chr12g01096351 [Helianthus anomalus]
MAFAAISFIIFNIIHEKQIEKRIKNKSNLVRIEYNQKKEFNASVSPRSVKFRA